MSHEAEQSVEAASGFDAQRLADWMLQHIPDYRGPLTVTRFAGGQSNPTYQLSTPARTYVLRKKPPGQLLKGAHAIEREVEVQKALASSGYPVPSVRGLCTNDEVIGTGFYVMDYVPGRIIWDATFPDVPLADRPLYFDAMNSAIAQLHCVDYSGLGLANFGKPGNYFSRQISRWSKQYRADADLAGTDRHMDQLIDWLSAHIPANDESAIVHGDFRIDNMIFDAYEPRILAVLDWELSTLGHPLADFAYHLLMYRLPPRIVAGLIGSDLEALHIPSEEQYVAAYCRRTGRDSITNLDSYLTFNLFRLAAICHGIKGRLLRGSAASSRAVEYANSFEWLAQLAWEQAERSRLE